MHLPTAFFGTFLVTSSLTLVSANPLSLPIFKNLDVTSAVTARRCGVNPTPEQILKAEAHFAKNRVFTGARAKLAGMVAAYIPPAAPFNVHFHVISDSASTGGYINNSQIENQIQVMNTDYSTTGISFKLVNITRTVNETWFNTAGPQSTRAIQTDMKTKLRFGGVKDLNIYTVGFRTDELAESLGYSTFPVDYERDPIDDGVVVSYRSLPGGNFTNYNLGRTLTHEVGHWLGLYHPFQGGCEGEGDDVSDTPPQATPTDGCPAEKDTCPGDGPDGIHNYMDYSYDSCMNNFTPGQTERMKDQLATYRNMTF